MKSLEQFRHGQLFWWRQQPPLHTLITLWGYPLSVLTQVDHFLLTFALFDPSGNLQTTWTQTLQAQECLFIDSASCAATQHLGFTEGVLAVFITTQCDNPTEVEPSPLYSILDWYSEAGELVTLHSDQLIRVNRKAVEWTEIVVCETAAEQNYLVVLNGSEQQQQKSIILEVKNHLGEVAQAVYEPTMAPFSMHQLHLAELFPNILAFGQHRPMTVSGTFASWGVFIRPYVVTQSKYLSGYHGGDRYFWNNLPAISYKFMGQGEVNPMVVVHQENLTTIINVLNSHADLEQDFWVDVCLYDCEGNLVVERKKWLLARRHQLCRAEIIDLLPDSEVPFAGHVALRFSNEGHSEYPRRLQALMEYRTPESVARVMAWSDRWNWQEKERFGVKVTYRAFYRVWCKPPFVSYISLTNCGIDLDYDCSVPYLLRLENGRGEFLTYEGHLAPQATLYKSIPEIFPNMGEVLANQSVGLIVVETPVDLASMHLTQNQNSGVFAAEHFLPAPTFHKGNIYFPCGS